jgi:hypothetical protein
MECLKKAEKVINSINDWKQVQMAARYISLSVKKANSECITFDNKIYVIKKHKELRDKLQNKKWSYLGNAVLATRKI